MWKFVCEGRAFVKGVIFVTIVYWGSAIVPGMNEVIPLSYLECFVL